MSHSVINPVLNLVNVLTHKRSYLWLKQQMDNRNTKERCVLKKVHAARVDKHRMVERHQTYGAKSTSNLDFAADLLCDMGLIDYNLEVSVPHL